MGEDASMNNVSTAGTPAFRAPETLLTGQVMKYILFIIIYDIIYIIPSIQHTTFHTSDEMYFSQ